MINVFLDYYYNFDVSNPTLPLTVVLWALWAGIVIASAASVYTRNHVGKLARALLKNECFTKEKAMSAAGLEIKPDCGMRRALKDGKMLRKYVYIANMEDCATVKKYSSQVSAIRRFFSLPDTKTVYDFSKAEFYIPEEKKYTAEVRYEKRGGTAAGIVITVLAAVFGAILVIALEYYIPKLLELLDDAITLFKNFVPKEK